MMKKVLLFALIVYLASSIGHQIYTSNFDFLHFTKAQANTEWIIRTIRDISLVITLSIGIITSIADYATAENKLLAKLWIVLSISSCLFLSIQSYFSYMQFNKSVYILEKPDPLENYIKTKDYEKRIMHSKSLSEKISLSNTVASRVYINSGKIINIVDKNNKFIPYIPSQNDIKKRNEKIHLNNMIKYTINSLKSAIYVWAFVLFISIAIGLILYKRNRAKLTRL